jgi:O-antigen ligase
MVIYWNYFKELKFYQQLFLFASALLLVGLSTSPALMSIGCGGILLSFLINWKELKINLLKLKNPIFLIISLYFLHFLHSFEQTNSHQLWIELRIKLPFLLIPLGFLGYKYNTKDFLILSFFFLISLFIVTFLTLLNYLVNFEEMNNRILESKEIPVFTKVTHIYFSVMLAFGVFLSYFIAKNFFIKIYYYLSIFLLICLHLFTSRTGLVGFYFAILFYAIFYLLKRKEYLVKNTIILISICLLPFVAYWLMPSFQNRIQNTVEDIQRYRKGLDINHRSVSMRLVTWEMGYEAFTKNPWFGVGMENIADKIHEEYQIHQVPLKKENWLNDLHNQYFEYLLGLGIVGFTIFVFWLIYPIFVNQNEIFLLFMGLFIGAMLAESILERQVGVCFGLFWYYFLFNFRSDEI